MAVASGKLSVAQMRLITRDILQQAQAGVSWDVLIDRVYGRDLMAGAGAFWVSCHIRAFCCPLAILPRYQAKIIDLMDYIDAEADRIPVP